MAGARLIVNLADSIDSYGPCAAAFQPSIEDTSALLTVLGDFSRDFALGTNTRVLFDGLLSNFLKLTDSEYGFIGERLLRPDGTPFLKTHAITNIAWDEATLAFYKEQAPKGMEFDNLNSLFGHVIRTGRPLISNDPATDQRAAGIPAGHPALAAFLGIPLFLGDHYLGMAGIANRPGGYDAELLRHLNPLISSTAALIHAAHMEKVASHDPLTGLANRRKFDERFAAEVSRHNRHGNDLSLLLIDIDSFKSINDTFGHLVGDHCLVQVAEILSKRVRAEDLVARYGGEEFALLLPDTSTHEAAAIADQLRRAISGNPFTPFERQESVKITISVGVATLEGKQHASFDALLERADKALYAAKRRGRNQVCSAQLEDLDL